MKSSLQWIASLFFPLALQANVHFTPLDNEQEAQEIINFLVSPSDQGGPAYVGIAGALNQKILPMSYYSTPDYWGAYIAQIPGNNCTVKDVYNEQDYTLTPAYDSPGADLQVERVNVYNGTDIYDAAVWQIALALAAHHGLAGPKGESLFEIANNQTLFLHLGYDGKATPPLKTGVNRALSQSANGLFSYNGQSITNPNQAYFFRMVTNNWLSLDPFKGTSYESYLSADELPPNPAYQIGKITWMDWKPITGENGWAFFIGALQAAYLQYYPQQGYIPHDHLAVQNALNILYAFRCMQSPIGGLYYATKGSLGNIGQEAVNPHEVSVENNASTLAGVCMLKQILQDILDHEPSLPPSDQQKMKQGMEEIDCLLKGGKTPQGYITEGLLAFFRKYAWDKNQGIFYQGGVANDPELGLDWQPTSSPKAVDVTTWGVTVLGQPLLDQWFGFGSAYQAWENVKKWGGFYGPNQQLWGVGYSDQDGNGASSQEQAGILSGEWTAGAINMVRALLFQYDLVQQSADYTSEEQALTRQYIQVLQEDEKSMTAHLTTLRSDVYPHEEAYAAVRPPQYERLISLPTNQLAYLYASKRYPIPFGWFANPLPSTASTGWALFLHYAYNPFKLGGDYQPAFVRE